MKLWLEDEAKTLHWAQLFAHQLVTISNCVIYLQGDLGTGKTCFTRGVLQALGYTGKVKSPTYTLLEPYIVADKQFVHMDLYRICSPEELEFIGLRDYLAQDCYLFIEWPEYGKDNIPDADVELKFKYQLGARQLIIQAKNQKAQTLVAALAGDN